MIQFALIMIGFAIAAPVFFILGMNHRSDIKITHEPADISRALRRP